MCDLLLQSGIKRLNMHSESAVSSSGDKIPKTEWVPPVHGLPPEPVPTSVPIPQLNMSDESDSKDSIESGKTDLTISDAEGVWSPEIESAFQEALAIYPPCGRRKIILSESGKMYGRNELVARHIKIRTGQIRTRKQVSSHIQVLARRKAKEMKLNIKNQTVKEKTFPPLTSLPSSAQIVFVPANQNRAISVPPPVEPINNQIPSILPVNYSRTSWETNRVQPGPSEVIHQFQRSHTYDLQLKPPPTTADDDPLRTGSVLVAYEGRGVRTQQSIKLIEFSAFVEKQRDPENYSRHFFIHIGDSPSFTDRSLETVDIREICDKFPEDTSDLLKTFDKGPGNAFFLIKFWTDINTDIEDEPSDFYGVNTEFQSSENMSISCSTKVCSFGKVVVEKVKTEYGRFENGHFVYRTQRAPMCDYVINFIRKLKCLPEHYMMNSVLEHFSVLCVVTNRNTQETLLCVAFVFEVSESEHGAQHHIYRLVKD